MEIKGLEEYIKHIHEAGESVNDVARSALAEIGPMLQAEMLRDVPVDEGELRDTIQIRTPSGEGDYNYINVGIIAGVATKRNAIKALVFEFGSVHIAARPFIRPAIARKRAAVSRLIRERFKAKGLVD